MSIESIKARLAAATPGPWEQKWFGTGAERKWSNSPGYGAVGLPECYGVTATGGSLVVMSSEWKQGHQDVELIAHAPTDLALLLNALQAYHSQHDTECKCSACDLYDVLEASL